MGKQLRLNHRGPVDPTDPVDPHDPGQGAPDPAVVARNLMLRKLSASARTRSELATMLGERGVPEDVAETAVERFIEVGLIDDAAFAGNYVSARSGARGRTALRIELRRRGIDDLTAEAALAHVSPDVERAAAQRLVEKRLRSLAPLDEATRTRRLVGMLARRGFAPGLALEVVRSVSAATIEADET